MGEESRCVFPTEVTTSLLLRVCLKTGWDAIPQSHCKGLKVTDCTILIHNKQKCASLQKYSGLYAQFQNLNPWVLTVGWPCLVADGTIPEALTPDQHQPSAYQRGKSIREKVRHKIIHIKSPLKLERQGRFSWPWAWAQKMYTRWFQLQMSGYPLFLEYLTTWHHYTNLFEPIRKWWKIDWNN